MKKFSSLNWGVAGAVAFLSLLIIACGGGGSAQLGTNSDVELVVTSIDIEDMSIIVAPRQGGPNTSNACREDNSGFGCTVELFNDATVYRFKTDSTASSQPYHVHIKNFANTTRRGTLDIYMDNDLNFTVGFEVFANETYFIARIFRNNADFATDTLSLDRTPRLLKGDAEKKAWIKGDDVGIPITPENASQILKRS